MRIFLFDWFGWSFLWLLPLAGRVVVSMLSGKGPGGRGAIRVWLGTLVVLCASSAIEALLRAQDDAAAQTAVVGHALAHSLTQLTGKLIGVLTLIAAGLTGLFWLFGRRRQAASDTDTDTVSLPMQASVPRRTQVNLAPVIRNLPTVQETGTIQSAVTQRKRDPWPLPGELPVSSSRRLAGRRADAWPTAQPAAETPQRPARPTSEWASFEALRPTQAMLARAKAVTPPERMPTHVSAPKPVLASSILSKPRITPVTGSKTKVRISTASDRSQAIPTSLRAALHNAQGQQTPAPQTPTVPLMPAMPVRTAAAAAAAASPAVAPALSSASVATMAADVQESETTMAGASFKIIDTGQAPEFAVVADLADTPSTHTSDINTVERLDTLPVPPASVAHAPARAASSPVPNPLPQQPAVVEPYRPQRSGTIPLPGIDLLDQGSELLVEMEAAQLAETGQLIEQRLKEFKVPVTVLGAFAGPVITRFEIEPALGVRGAQIVNLMKDLARALGLTSIRVVETIPGKTCMGLELPNPKRQMIRLAEIIRSEAYARSASHLTLAMGKDITGVPVATDLARAPHMLVAGTTGSGKSVAINAMILSLLYKATPEDVRLIMIDPKMLELSVYDGIPHLLAPVVTDMKLAAHALSWCVAEMDKRYRLMSSLGVRNLAGYNQKIADGIAAENRVKNPFSLTPDMPEPLEALPMIVVVIDELADLMMVAGKKIEELIARLAQKARAAGIHLILATQRPSVDVITGLIKANIPTRVAFQVSSKIDSRTVLDQMGAETLLGHGDMLFLPPGSGYPQRVHGAFVSDEEVHRVVEHLKAYGEPQYEEAILAGPASEEPQQGDMFGDAGDEADPLYDDAVAYVTRSRRASISSVQRQFRIGYNRAARLVEQMEAAGILSSMSKSGGRDVLAPPPPD